MHTSECILLYIYFLIKLVVHTHIYVTVTYVNINTCMYVCVVKVFQEFYHYGINPGKNHKINCSV